MRSLITIVISLIGLIFDIDTDYILLSKSIFLSLYELIKRKKLCFRKIQKLFSELRLFRLPLFMQQTVFRKLKKLWGEPMLKRLKSVTVTDGSARFEIPSGIYRGLFLTWDGTNQSGQTLTSDNLGTIRILKDGKEKTNVSVERMVDIWNGIGGTLEESSTAGGAFRHVCYLPFFLPNDEDTALIVKPGDIYEVECNFAAATSTVVASGTFTAFAHRGNPTQLTPYEVQWRNHNISVGAAGTLTHKLQVENVSSIFVENDSTVLTSLLITADNEPVLDNINRDDIYAIDQALGHTETFSAAKPMMQVDLNPGGEAIGALSDDVQMEIVAAAAGTLDIVVLSAFPTPKKSAASVSRRQNWLSKRLRGKVGRGAQAAIDEINREMELLQ